MNHKDLALRDEQEAIRQIRLDCECHYQFQNKIMFSSRTIFYEWLENEVRFHADLMRLDYEKGKEAYLSWATENHHEEYEKVK